MSDDDAIELEHEPSEMPEHSDDDVQWDNDLDSDEISEILGFDLSAEEGDDRSGLRALINSALVTHRRLPMLDVIFDRTARQLTTNLRKLTDDNVEVTLDDVSSTRFGDFIGTLPTPSVVGVVKSKLLDNYCLIAVDSELIYSVVDLLLGGRRSGGALMIDDRKFTPIELALTQRVLGQVIDAFGAAFETVAALDLSLDRIETTPRFAAIAQHASVCSLAKYRIDMDGRGGRAVILTPHATLEPVHKLLLREFIGEANGNEGNWREGLMAEIAAATLDLRAVLAEKEMTLSDVASLEPGQTVTFSVGEHPKAQIRAGDAVVATGAVGKKGRQIALRLIDSPAEMVEISDGEAA